MWEGHLDRISVGKHCIEPPDDNVQPVQSAGYRAVPKTRKSKKIDIETILRGIINEPARTEWAAPIVFVPEKEGCLR